jgi:hypothetical protein
VRLACAQTSNFKNQEYKSTSNLSLPLTSSELKVGPRRQTQEPAQEPPPRFADAAEAELHRSFAARRAETEREINAHRQRESIGVNRIADHVQARIDAQTSPAAIEQRVQERIGTMWRRIKDGSPKPHVFRARLARVAWACEEHGLPWKAVISALDNLDVADRSGTLREPRSSYFQGCIDNLLRMAGLPPRQRKPGRPR